MVNTLKAYNPGYIIHILTYISNDYKEAVKDSKVISQEEYNEMLLFIDDVSSSVNNLETNKSALDSLKEETKLLSNFIKSKSSPELVKNASNQLIIKLKNQFNYKPLPTQYPSLSNGKIVYKTNCSKCHGENGMGDGKDGLTLNPPPRNFKEESNMIGLSAFSVFNTVRYGISGTGMLAHPTLTDQETWDVSFYVLSLEGSSSQPDKFNYTLEEICYTSNQDIDKVYGKNAHHKVRSFQEETTNAGRFSIALSYFNAALEQILKGDLKESEKQITFGYLNGIEPNEVYIESLSSTSKAEIEKAVIEAKTALKNNDPSKTSLSLKKILSILSDLEVQNEDKSFSPFMSFFMTVSILLREGLEALLVILIFINVLSASNQHSQKKVVHLGWISAIVVGLVLWFLFEKILSANKWNIEVLEGVVTLSAVAMMIYVGMWLHRKSSIDQWKAFIVEKLKGSSRVKTLMGIFSLSFLIVFREIFESILFISSINLQSKGQHLTYILAGVVASFALIITLYFLITKFSKKLPFEKMINYSVATLCILAVVMVGKAIHSFQEAGIVTQTSLPIPSIAMIGLYNTLETVLTQVFIAVLLFWVFKKMKTS